MRLLKQNISVEAQKKKCILNVFSKVRDLFHSQHSSVGYCAHLIPWMAEQRWLHALLLKSQVIKSVLDSTLKGWCADELSVNCKLLKIKQQVSVASWYGYFSALKWFYCVIGPKKIIRQLFLWFGNGLEYFFFLSSPEIKNIVWALVYSLIKMELRVLCFHCFKTSVFRKEWLFS